jgi:hypothetical protein
VWCAGGRAGRSPAREGGGGELGVGRSGARLGSGEFPGVETVAGGWMAGGGRRRRVVVVVPWSRVQSGRCRRRGFASRTNHGPGRHGKPACHVARGRTRGSATGARLPVSLSLSRQHSTPNS